MASHLLGHFVCNLCEFFASNTLTQNTQTTPQMFIIAQTQQATVWPGFSCLCGCVWVRVSYRCLNTLFLLGWRASDSLCCILNKCALEKSIRVIYTLSSRVCVCYSLKSAASPHILQGLSPRFWCERNKTS